MHFVDARPYPRYRPDLSIEDLVLKKLDRARNIALGISVKHEWFCPCFERAERDAAAGTFVFETFLEQCRGCRCDVELTVHNYGVQS